MAIPANGSVPGTYSTSIVSFTAAQGTLARIIADVAPASGNLLGGSRAFDIAVSSTDSTAAMITLWEAQQLTLYANMGTATTTATTNATVTRTVGSFIAEGWRVGDGCMLDGSAGASNNGNPAIVTVVAAGTLTFNGVPASFSANTEAAGFRLFRVAKRAPLAVPANAGNPTSNTVANANVQLVGQGNDQTKDTLGIELGATSALFASLYQACSALPAQISIITKLAMR